MALKLKVNERRTLQFEVQIGGIDYKELVGTLRVFVDNVEYGFPAEIHSESISVNLPALNSVVMRSLKDDELLLTKLELVGNGFYMDPWRSEFRVVNPVKVEAKIISEEESKPKAKKKVSVKLVEDEVILPKKDDDRKIIIDDEEEETAKSLAEKKIEEMKKTVDKFLSEGTQKRVKKVPKKKVVRNYVRPDKVSEKDVYKLMEAKGLKNQRTQEAIIERAKDMCLKDGNTGPDPEEIYEVVEKMLSTKVR